MFLRHHIRTPRNEEMSCLKKCESHRSLKTLPENHVGFGVSPSVTAHLGRTLMVNPSNLEKQDRRLVSFGCVHSSNIAMENGPLEDVFRIEHGDLPLLC